jgi:hypothetical protein
MDNAAIGLDQSPYYVSLDKGNNTAYVLSGVLASNDSPEPMGTSITPIVYSKVSGFKAGSTVGLNGTMFAVAADPVGHLIYAATSFGDGWGPVHGYGVQIYDPSRNFEQVGFFPLPIPVTYDYAGLFAVQMGIHGNRLFVGTDNLTPTPGASGVVYVIDDFSSSPKITAIEDIEPYGEGMQNFSFFEDRLYFVNYNSKNLICIDIDKKAVVSVTDVSDGAGATGGTGWPMATAISSSKREIYVAQYNGVVNSSIKTLGIVAEVPVPLGHIPLTATVLRTMDIDDGNKFICGGSMRTDNFLTFVDSSADKEETHRVAMDGAVLSVALDAVNHRAFIANATSKKVFCYAQKFFPV